MLKIVILLFIAYIQYSATEIIKWNNIIEQVNSAKSTWKAGYNFDPLISPNSLKPLIGATFEKGYDGPYKKFDSDNLEVPKTFDARKKWATCHSIGHIRDQGHCGSCWAVAAAEALTDRFCVAFKGKHNPPLSTEDLLSCCNDCGHGCNGGSPWYAWNYFRRFGIVTGGDYQSRKGCRPYSLQPCEHHVNGTRRQCSSLPEYPTPACHFRCSNKKYYQPYWGDHHKVEEFYIFGPNETIALQKDILKYGPVEASFRVYEDFMTYKSGIYQHITGELLGGHAVKIIGWGEENGVPYWLVVNSWNRDWGENGYFRIKRGNDECKFESFVLAGIPHRH